MSEPFLAEIKIFGFNFAPRGWAFCDGQILPINQNQSLYSLLGTTYGGDGRTSFGLPDLRSRTPTHEGVARLGTRAGTEAVSLSVAELPPHSHVVRARNEAGNTPLPGGNALAGYGSGYGSGAATATLAPSVVSNAGGGQAHNNTQPSLVVSFCIALQGLFPSRN